MWTNNVFLQLHSKSFSKIIPRILPSSIFPNYFLLITHLHKIDWNLLFTLKVTVQNVIEPWPKPCLGRQFPKKKCFKVNRNFYLEWLKCIAQNQVDCLTHFQSNPVKWLNWIWGFELKCKFIWVLWLKIWQDYTKSSHTDRDTLSTQNTLFLQFLVSNTYLVNLK